MTEAEARAAWVEAVALSQRIMRDVAALTASGQPPATGAIDVPTAGGLAERVLAIAAWQATQDNDEGEE